MFRITCAVLLVLGCVSTASAQIPGLPGIPDLPKIPGFPKIPYPGGSEHVDKRSEGVTCHVNNRSARDLIYCRLYTSKYDGRLSVSGWYIVPAGGHGQFYSHAPGFGIAVFDRATLKQLSFNAPIKIQPSARSPFDVARNGDGSWSLHLNGQFKGQFSSEGLRQMGMEPMRFSTFGAVDQFDINID